MDRNEAQAQLSYIKTVLERSTRYTNLSPWSALTVGCFGLAAGAYSQVTASLASTDTAVPIPLLLCWTVCLLGSVSTALLFTLGRARRNHVALWAEPAKQGLLHFGVLFAVGGVLTFALGREHLLFLIPAVWMLCYGAGLIVSSTYSLTALRYLGYYFGLGGTAALIFPAAGFWLLMATFGFGHLVLAIAIFRNDRTLDT